MSARKAKGPAAVLLATAEVSVALPRAKAWRVFTREIRSWWPADFATRKGSRMVFDPAPGGALREEWGPGCGLTWYEVAGADRGRWLLLQGDLTAAYGGPARSHVEIRFEDAPGGGTTVTLRDTVFAGGSETLRGNMESGWRLLLGEAYAARCAKTR